MFQDTLPAESTIPIGNVGLRPKRGRRSTNATNKSTRKVRKATKNQDIQNRMQSPTTEKQINKPDLEPFLSHLGEKLPRHEINPQILAELATCKPIPPPDRVPNNEVSS